jgi:hypothetical protein
LHPSTAHPVVEEVGSPKAIDTLCFQENFKGCLELTQGNRHHARDPHRRVAFISRWETTLLQTAYPIEEDDESPVAPNCRRLGGSRLTSSPQRFQSNRCWSRAPPNCVSHAKTDGTERSGSCSMPHRAALFVSEKLCHTLPHTTSRSGSRWRAAGVARQTYSAQSARLSRPLRISDPFLLLLLLLLLLACLPARSKVPAGSPLNYADGPVVFEAPHVHHGRTPRPHTTAVACPSAVPNSLSTFAWRAHHTALIQ